VDLDRKSNPII